MTITHIEQVAAAALAAFCTRLSGFMRHVPSNRHPHVMGNLGIHRKENPDIICLIASECIRRARSTMQ